MSLNLVRRAVKAFEGAWKASINDYASARINSERCLQAALYHHLRWKVSGKFKILIEAKVEIGTRLPIFIDMLIVHDSTIVVAVELKYKPRGRPGKADVAGDLTKLIRFRNRKAKDNKCRVALLRYRKQDHEAEVFRLSPDRRIIFAAFCKSDAPSMTTDEFWAAHRPWLQQRQLGQRNVIPPKLIVCVAKCDLNGTADPEVFGRGRFPSSQ